MADFAEPPRWEQPTSRDGAPTRRAAVGRKRRRRLPGVAWLGITGAVVLVAGLSYAIWFESALENIQPAGRDDVGAISSARVVPGMCLAEPRGEDRVLDAVQVVPCAEPHYGEVVYAVPFDLEEWPGVGHVRTRALDRCAGVLSPGAGLLDVAIKDAGLSWSAWVPTAATWRSGDRAAMCVVFADEPWEGSIFGGSYLAEPRSDSFSGTNVSVS